MLKSNKMRIPENITVNTAFWFAIGGGVGAALVGLMSVVIAALAGWMIGWMFPATFAAFMTMIGLGAYQVWQLSAVVAYASFIVKSFRG